MEDKLDKYSDILTRLVSEAVACTPPEWKKGTLTIECDGIRINYKLTCQSFLARKAIIFR